MNHQDPFRERLKAFREGTLSEADEREMEEELDKLDAYNALLEEEMGGNVPGKQSEEMIIGRSKWRARWTSTLITLVVLLLILPAAYMGTLVYYALHPSLNANKLIEVLDKTVYVTEPNMTLEEMQIETQVHPLSLTVDMELWKKVGNRDIRAGKQSASFILGRPNGFPKVEYFTDAPLPKVSTEENRMLVHPGFPSLPYLTGTEWRRLEKLPEGTVAEAYVSLNRVTGTDEALKALQSGSVEVVWYAVDTGFEQRGVDSGGRVIGPIGYPAQEDWDAWSPFNDTKENAEQFMDTLVFLKNYEKMAALFSRSQSLELDKRIRYLKDNGIKTYGAVVTGPVKDLAALSNNPLVRGIKVGEVRLWN
ncbi:anti sigma factor C-terminal domain-containing protein [Paenibacillus sp. RC84]|uniref:anti-sigma factor n=1 Tax=Paenibacillus sp. RC84 TaxID=3156252 RepID=UPI003516518D